MTTRLIVAPPKVPVNKQFPAFPPRDDMQNLLHLHEPAHVPVLRRWLGNRSSAIVISELPLSWVARQQQGYVIPDLLIAFDVNRDDIIREGGYAIDDWGKPPEFVMEIASPNNARNDYISKRTKYAEYGVPEYWRFDNTGGDRYPQALAGDLLVDGEYRPITVTEVEWARYRGHSPALNLEICWEYGYMRLRDPATGVYLPTHDQVDDARIAAEAQRDAERDARIAERNARIAAEIQRDAERDARIAAEAEAARLRERLQNLPGE